MFGKKDLSTADKIETILGRDTAILGSIVGEGIVRLDGKVEGEEVRHGEVIIGESGEIKANIVARQLTVAGILKGNATVEGKVEIVGSGKIIGNIRSSNLVISEGAVFQGNCDMNIRQEKISISADALLNTNE